MRQGMTLICFLLGDSPCRESRREARALSSRQMVSADLAQIVAQGHRWQCYFARATNTANTPHEPMAMSTDFEAQCFEKWASPPDTNASVSNMPRCSYVLSNKLPKDLACHNTWPLKSAVFTYRSMMIYPVRLTRSHTMM